MNWEEECNLVWNHTHDFKITSMISDQNCTTQSSITSLNIISILKSLIFLNLYWSTRLVCKKLNWKHVYMYTWTKQNDPNPNPNPNKNSLECKGNKSQLHSCKCSSMSSKILLLQKINSLLQSLILVVWLNNISPSLLQRLWLRHRVFLGEKIESTASVILTKKNDNLLST